MKEEEEELDILTLKRVMSSEINEDAESVSIEEPDEDTES